jgi:peptidyl-prolyl cis-trans isomerase C
MLSLYCNRVLYFLVVSTISIWDDFPVVGGSITEKVDQNNLEALRLKAKPWYMKNVSFGDNIEVPISPATLMISFVTIFYIIYYYYNAQCFCVASHILIKDMGKETKLKLEQWKDKIGVNSQLFGKYAADHSECPSGKHNGGHLGKFYMYDMAPNFNSACFDKKTPLQTTIGPIQTQFGYHLIYIHERQIPK